MPRNLVHTGRKIQVFVETTELPDGRVITRDLIQHPGAVIILPVLDDDRVVLLRNHRPNVGETLWEIPAGTLEPAEDPAVAAARELAEETGYQAATWRKLGEMYPSPGVLSEKMHLFLASDLTPGPQQLEADEEIEVHPILREEALAWAFSGVIRDAKTIVALCWLERIRAERR
jgi:ADP-ribose pyrophosphatase